MLSMLVVGVAGSIVGVGSGTLSLFTAVTTSTGNTFTSAQISLSSTNNGGTCTSTAGATATGTCTAMPASFTALVPGSMRTFFSTLTNVNSTNGGAFTVNLVITDTAGTHDNVVTYGIGTAGSTTTGTQGYGLLIFECRTAAHADTSCSGGSVGELYTVYGSCGSSGSPSTFATVTQSGAFSSSNVASNGLNDNGVKIGTGTNGYCYGGNTGGSGSGIAGSAGTGPTIPIIASSGSPVVGNGSNSLAVAATDNLAMVLYLPYTADNTVQNKTNPNLTFTWTATQVPGTSL
jgi:hypothetical protein